MRDPLWRPEKTRAAQTTLGAFSVWMASRAGKPFSDYDELHRYSTDNPAEFWSALWDFAGVLGGIGWFKYRSTRIEARARYEADSDYTRSFA